MNGKRSRDVDVDAVERYFAVFREIGFVSKPGGILGDPDPAVSRRRKIIAESPILAGDPEIKVGTGLVVHVPEIRADRHRHPDPIPGVVRTSFGIAARHPEVIADHLLVVFKTSRAENHRLLCLDVYLLAFVFCNHAPDLSGFNVSNQFHRRRFILDPDFSFLEERSPSAGATGVEIRFLSWTSRRFRRRPEIPDIRPPLESSSYPRPFL